MRRTPHYLQRHIDNFPTFDPHITSLVRRSIGQYRRSRNLAGKIRTRARLGRFALQLLQ